MWRGHWCGTITFFVAVPFCGNSVVSSFAHNNCFFLFVVLKLDSFSFHVEKAMTRVLVLSNPRSGSSLLQDLLNCHGDVQIAEELLNDEFGFIENPLEKVKASLGELHKTIVGFKVFPEQIYRGKITFSELVAATAASQVIVLWRENMLDAYCSRCIANLSGEW